MSKEPFFNTIGETGRKLAESKLKVGSQASYIYEYFKDNPTKLMSPHMVFLRFYSTRGWLKSSIRARMTTLTDNGLLVKTDKQVEGPYGHKEYLWKLGESNGNV